jgi:hypothetical protein
MTAQMRTIRASPIMIDFPVVADCQIITSSNLDIQPWSFHMTTTVMALMKMIWNKQQ